MKKETRHYSGRFGVHFNVTALTILPADRAHLRELHLREAGPDHWRVLELVVSTYDRMLAQQLPCEMTVAISRPLTRQQAELFNAERGLISAAIGSAAGYPIKRWNKKAATAVGTIVGGYVLSEFDTHHASDVIVAVHARVNGGIGPQHSSLAFLLKAGEGGR